MAFGRQVRLILVAGTDNCHLEDMSQTGARVTLTRLAPQPRDGVMLVIGEERIFAMVVWHRGRECGLAFDKPMTAEDLARFHASLPPRSITG